MNQDPLTIGERIKLGNGKSYYCLNTVEHDSRRYALLITDSQPLEMCFVEQTQTSLRIIGGKEEKQQLKQLFEDSVKQHGGAENV